MRAACTCLLDIDRADNQRLLVPRLFLEVFHPDNTRLLIEANDRSDG